MADPTNKRALLPEIMERAQLLRPEKPLSGTEMAALSCLFFRVDLNSEDMDEERRQVMQQAMEDMEPLFLAALGKN